MNAEVRSVQKIESCLSICDKIEEPITNSLKQAEALRQSILKKAFEGKLVETETNIKPDKVVQMFPQIVADISTADLHAGILVSCHT